MKYLCFILWFLFLATNVQAKLHTETVEYKDGDTVLEGYLAYDDAIRGKRPGVMVVHEWTGLCPYVKKRANELAELGYIAFAADHRKVELSCVCHAEFISASLISDMLQPHEILKRVQDDTYWTI